jgi:tetratricopeptide (TPR) repeat protein
VEAFLDNGREAFTLVEEVLEASPLVIDYDTEVLPSNVLEKAIFDMVVAAKDISLKDIEGPYEFKCSCQDIYGPFGFPSLCLSPRCSLLFEIQLRCADLGLAVLIPMNFEEAVKLAEEVKAGGNALITGKEPKFADARLAYIRALELLDPFIRLLSTVRSTNANDMAVDLEDGQRTSLREKLNVYCLNLAHCELELQRPGLALALCSRVLESDPMNAKAHYRIGLVYERCHHISAAKWHFHQSNAIAPTALSKKKVEALKEIEEKEREAKRKKLFEGMFSGGEYNQRRKKF